MLHETLKSATKQNHDELERLMFVNDIMSGTLTLQQYKQILTTNYLVHKAYEAFLLDNLSPEVAQQLNIGKRQKLPALIADMQAVNIELPTVQNEEETAFEKSNASILGAMYVLEGATLGGSVIVKRLKTNPELSTLNLDFNYYQVYGSELIPYWKTFCALLDQQGEDSYDDAVNSAKKMFDCIASVQLQNNNLVG
ncbi:biliverdin-producing heme oxygenase [Mucilaginibacter sp.]